MLEVIVVGLLLSATFAVLAELIRPKPKFENAKPANLGDFSFPTAIEGRPIPVPFGINKYGGPNVTWYGNFRQKKIKEKVKTGLWSSTNVVVGWRYFIGIQFSLCTGPILGITRVWIGDDVVYDGPPVADGEITINEPNLFGGIEKGSGGVVGTLFVKPGSTTQTALPYLAPFQVPAIPYRKTAYCVFDGEIGTSTNILPWSFEIARFPNTLGITGNLGAIRAWVTAQGIGYVVGDILTLSGGTGTPATFEVIEVEDGNVVRVVQDSAGSYSSAPASPVSTTGGSGSGCTLEVLFLGPHAVNDGDSNPAAIFHEYLVDTDWGRGLPSTDVDEASLLALATTLHSEGNGFSFVMDSQLEATDFLDEVERQIDGKMLYDRSIGKFFVAVARGGYDIETVPQLTNVGPGKNVVEVERFDDGLWQDTTNDVRVQFSDRSRDYFDTYARSDDLANLRIQGERVIQEVRFPGVKHAALANRISARLLTQRSIPLKTAVVVSDRSMWNLKPVEVIAWTDSVKGFSRLAMRVVDVDIGSLDENRVRITMVQDVFGFGKAIFGAPQRTLWTPPTQDLDAIPAAEQVVIEAPYALLRRDPDLPLVLDRLWVGARAQTGAEATFKVYQRNDPTTPSGPYVDSGEVSFFLLIGEVRTALSASGAGPGSEVLEIDPDPDARLEIFGEFTQNPSISDLGQNLVNLLYVEGEWMSFPTIVDSTTHVTCSAGYRGMLDSTPKAHAVGAKVFLAFVGGGLSFDSILQPNVVDVQLRPTARSGELAEVDATTVQLQMDNVARRAIVPVEPKFNGVRYDDPVDIDDLAAGGSGLDASGIQVVFRRRDYRFLDEVQSLLNDAASLAVDFPGANSHENRLNILEVDETLTTSLEAFWKLSEATSAIRLDSTVNDVDLTDNGGVQQLASGKIGAAALFDGSDDFLEASTAGELDYGDVDFSFCGWARLDSKPGDRVVFSKFTVQGNQQSYLFSYSSALDVMQLQVSSDGSTATTLILDSFNPQVGEWFWFYIEHDATLNRIRGRINMGPWHQADHAGGAFSSTAKFRIGNNVDSGGNPANHWLGAVDALGSWSRLLSETEQGLSYFLTDGQEHPFDGRREVHLVDWSVFAQSFISRTLWLERLDGDLPSSDYLAIILARHTFEAQVFQSRESLVHQFSLDTSDLGPLVSLGVVRSGWISPVYVVDSTATWNFEIGTPLHSAVDARLNGGSFSTLIAAGSTTGTLAVTNGDYLQVRHSISDPEVTAGSFVTGVEYVILSIGTTDFTLIGAASNTVGEVFTATGAGSGTGTASPTAVRTLLMVKDATPTNKAFSVLTKSTTPVLASLGAHYKLNESSGVAIDAHTNGLDLGTGGGSIGTFADGVIDSARGVYNTSDFHSRIIAAGETFDTTFGSVSVSFFCFFRLVAFTTDHMIAAIWNASFNNTQAFFLRAQSAQNDVVFAMGDGVGGSEGLLAGMSSVPVGEWIAVGFAFDHQTDTQYLYTKRFGFPSIFKSHVLTGFSGFQNSNRHSFSLGGANGLPGLNGYIDSASWWKGRFLAKPQFDWLAEGHDLEEFDQIP